MVFTWPERAVFIALLLVSVWGFWMRFRGLWRNVTASKHDPDFTLRSLSLRIRDVVLEVLLQSKVIRQRPLPGIAHALVFWGFCAFALITINHFAVGLNTSVLDRHVLAGKFYYWFAAFFAALVAVSIAGLAFRRFVIRPRWLGNISYESGLIAFLIFFLMVTYLATFLPGGQESKPLWWAHTLTILFFLPLIPHTKHVHLVLSPFTVFTKRNGFSKIPPLGDEDDFGLKAGKDVTKLVAFQVYTCVECGRPPPDGGCVRAFPRASTPRRLPKSLAGVPHFRPRFVYLPLAISSAVPLPSGRGSPAVLPAAPCRLSLSRREWRFRARHRRRRKLLRHFGEKRVWTSPGPASRPHCPQERLIRSLRRRCRALACSENAQVPARAGPGLEHTPR